MPQAAGQFSIPIESFAIPFDENGFVDWIVDPNTHDCIAYYRGLLGHDRCESVKVLTPADCRKLANVARRVMVAAEQGLVFLVQKRLGPHDFVYFAVRATARLNAPSRGAHRKVLAASPSNGRSACSPGAIGCYAQRSSTPRAIASLLLEEVAL